MLKDFRAFIAKGNVLDLAVAVIIGAAFGKIVTSLTDDIIMPIVGKIFGGLDFSSHFLLLGPVPADYHGSMTDYAALKKAGAPVLGWGQFVTEVVSFVILAFIIFLMVRWATKAMKKQEAAVPAGPSDDRHRLVGERAQLTHDGNTHEVVLINLSGGGAMIETSIELLIWDRVHLHLGDHGDIECTVRWVRDGRIGLEFAHETRLDG